MTSRKVPINASKKVVHNGISLYFTHNRSEPECVGPASHKTFSTIYCSSHNIFTHRKFDLHMICFKSRRTSSSLELFWLFREYP